MKLTSIDEVFNETLDIIERRSKGEQFGYLTEWSNFNRALGSGITYNTNLTIGGRTGTGKSAFCNLLLLGILNNNPIDNVVVFYWNWEMLNYQQGLRLISSKTNKSVNSLMSTDQVVTKEEIEALKDSVSKLRKFPVYFIETPANSQSISALVNHYVTKDPRFIGKNIINFFDHTRLVLQHDLASEEIKIHKFYEVLQTLKKQFRCTNVILSQLNRKLEDDYNRSGRYRPPILSDIFGSDAAAQYSETVLLLHRPELYHQINLEPVRIGKDTYEVSAEGKLVAELAKNRDGPIGNFVFNHNLKNNQITEWTPPQKSSSPSYEQPTNPNKYLPKFSA